MIFEHEFDLPPKKTIKTVPVPADLQNQLCDLQKLVLSSYLKLWRLAFQEVSFLEPCSS